MDKEIYGLEELKMSELSMQKLDEIALSLIKFYFVTVFSVTTVVITLYDKLFINHKGWLGLVFLFPLLFGFSAIKSLKKLTSRYIDLQEKRDGISQLFVFGKIKNNNIKTDSIIDLLLNKNFWN